ncbi:MAG: hypothetical protein II587_03800, partial [Oscillospiraceae bacterium]|nr:hypothetical protein [Oscillospiraceae bacterium]
MKKKFLSLLIVLAMMLSMVPMAFADDSDEYSAYLYADYGCDMSTIGAVYNEEVASAITADASWLETYDEETNSYTISTTGQLLHLITSTRTSDCAADATILLDGDLFDFGGRTLKPLEERLPVSLNGCGS